jgi:hypothetical protein
MHHNIIYGGARKRRPRGGAFRRSGSVPLVMPDALFQHPVALGLRARHPSA